MIPKALPTVLHLIDTGGSGGAETVFSELAERLNGDQLTSLTVIPREGWLSERLRNKGLQPLILNPRGSLNVRYLRELIKIVRGSKVKLIHAHLLGSSVYAAIVGMILRLPVLAVIHGPHDLSSPGSLPQLKRMLLRYCCSTVVAVSESTRDAMVAFGIPKDEITLIKNGIDTHEFTPGTDSTLREELGLAADALLVGAVGNIRGPKAYDILLRSAAIVTAKMTNVHFAVVGGGNETEMRPLLDLQRKLGLEAKFHFLGFRKSSSAIYRNFDVFVSSSRSEGLPLSFLEAMASGRCLVATRSGGAEEVIEPNRTGLLVPIEDPAALASALEQALRNVDLRQMLGQAARQHVATEFSLESTVKKYLALYEQLLHR